jgi:hypothetical protein
MSKLLNSFIVVLLFGVLSCSKDNNSTSIKAVVVNTVSSSTWKITNLSENGVIKTANTAGYNFTFGSNGILTSANGTNTYTGTWSVLNSNSNDDSLDDLDFVIVFLTPSAFEPLNEDWEILSRTDSKIELHHISGGGGGTDLLTFEKN